ncbi:HelD family protein [Vallicoccus soli]|uniref:AAA family ATPase n=1 Tax=Vallicoccus soli TaxID=2339232 RepID=A0A3A3Z421_9ACTN|nr:ATP-binding domain-containing protein [Vallicoccus soli]RJK97668.1 AAA family ATPase [Vallicoccus soli]
MTQHASPAAAEQPVVDTAYARLDELRSTAQERLDAVRRSRPSGTAQSRSERDAFAQLYEDRLAQLRGVEDRLVFGRLDLRDGTTRYVGRIGMSDEDQRQLLVDWRAPGAEQFYQATAAAAGDVVRRRHIALRGRTVTGVEDEVLDLDAPAEGDLVLSGEGALMAALAEHRTGRMRDIVGTIQAEQDRVVRAPLAGVLVVQGGPGTGKTAVALHRAAYLLYTHRERLERSGVLVVGPSPVFLRYIEQVLPSLGETGVVMSTPAELYPGVVARGAEDPRAAALKGDLRMAKVVRRAVDARQVVPAEPVPLRVEGTTVHLRPQVVAEARARARRSGKPHNAVRATFVKQVLDSLLGQLARELRVTLDEHSRPELLASLREAPDVRREVNLCWMPLTPERLLADLLADPRRLAAAAPWTTPAQRRLLARPRDAAWTPADVPLLDEAAELLGEDDTAARLEARRAAAERAAEVRYAQGALQLSGAGAMVSAELLADRFADHGPRLSLAERAGADRTWAFGHVVVDEAQELTPMHWRLLARRCPSRSMTLVGDVAQTAALGGATSWAAALDPVLEGRWTLEELTVGYRTPAGITAVAAGVLEAAGVDVRPPRAAREGEPPVAHRLARTDAAAVAGVLRGELARLGGGRLAVVVPRRGHEDLAAGLPGLLPPGTVGAGGLDDAPVSVLDVEQVKGLEFDVVVLVEPLDVLEQSPRGANDLYVALTRPTQRLVVVHARDLPPGMGALRALDRSA